MLKAIAKKQYQEISYEPLQALVVISISRSYFEKCASGYMKPIFLKIMSNQIHSKYEFKNNFSSQQLEQY